MSRAPYVLSKSETPFDRGKTVRHHAGMALFVNPRLAELRQRSARHHAAENVAQRQHISREEQDLFALASQQKARRAIDSGRLAREITPVDGAGGSKRPAHSRRTSFPAQHAATVADALKPAFSAGGTVTAGNASGISDGAAVPTLAPGAT